ncbi:MAG: thioredoxin family protein [Planctomycetes bacterium]|nr:thioredoxin family protein [Planctomycetota bacterium]
MWTCRPYSAWLALAAVAAVCPAPGQSPAPRAARPAPGDRPVEWWADLDAAAARARETGRDVLIAFVGSGWNPPCRRLCAEVLDSGAFAAVERDFVCAEVEFPNDPARAGAELVARCEALQERFGIERLPIVLITDAQLLPYARCPDATDRDGRLDAESFVAGLTELRATRERRDAALARAAASDGLERARALAAAVDAVERGLQRCYREQIRAVVELADTDADTDADTALRDRFAARLAEIDREEARFAAWRQMRETLRGLQPLVQSGRYGDAADRIAAFAAARGGDLDVDQRVQLGLIQASLLERAGALADAVAAYRAARALRPDDPRFGALDAHIAELERELGRDGAPR